MSNIINKIRLSGTDYTLSATSSGGASAVEVTQAEYDALVSGGTVDPNTFYIITDGEMFNPSGKVDTSAFTEFSGSVETALSGKQDTLSAGTGIDITDNVISATGGGGSSYTAGDGIDITNDVISVTGKADTSAVTAIQDSLSGYVTTYREQNITGNKTFIGSGNLGLKPITFKQANNNHKIGFTCQNTASTNNEVATFEFRPDTFTIDSVKHPLLYLGHYRNTNTANAGVPQTVIGFRQYDQLNAAAYHYLMPLPEKAKTPFSLTTSYKNYFAPLGFKVDSGGTMVTTDNTGVVDLSSYLGGGGGSSYTAGRGIDITNDTISFSLPISAGTGTNSIIEGRDTTASGRYSHAEGYNSNAQAEAAHAEGFSTAKGNYCHSEGFATQAYAFRSHAEGAESVTYGDTSHAEGKDTRTYNHAEHASGRFNVSSSASTTFGDSGNTLFSVGNGTDENNRHNAFEIRQNGDIYLTKDGQDVKLQDQLGGGGSTYTAGDGIDITNDVISVTGKASTSDVNRKQDTLVSGTNIKTINGESLLGSGNITIDGGGTIDQSVISGSTNAVSGGAVYTQLGGLKLQKITQSAYDALATKDANTLYVING